LLSLTQRPPLTVLKVEKKTIFVQLPIKHQEQDAASHQDKEKGVSGISG
ncbi:MAG: hypothetical protein AWU57_3638, partial [Marinobacter sp. T13-3]